MVHIKIQKPARKIIFLRGLLRGNFHWRPLIEVTKLMPEKDRSTFEPIFIELAGCGDRHQELSPINPDVAVADLRRQLQSRLQPDEKFEICAISLGGMLALHWAQKHPDEILKLTIINSSSSSLSSVHERVNLKALLDLILTSMLHPENIERSILKFTCTQQDRALKYLSEFSRYSQEHPLKKMNLLRQLILATSFPKPSRLACDLDFIYGKNDQFVNPLCSVKLHEALGGKIIELENCGHDASVDRPEALIQILTSGINR